jgi:hypothetical protein
MISSCHTQDMNDFKGRLSAFLRQHGTMCSLLCASHTPGLLAAFLQLTGNVVRMHLLAPQLPFKQIIQLYTLVYATVEVALFLGPWPSAMPSATASHTSNIPGGLLHAAPEVATI